VNWMGKARRQQTGLAVQLQHHNHPAAGGPPAQRRGRLVLGGPGRSEIIGVLPSTVVHLDLPIRPPSRTG
jgi:hypothetical protein